MKIIFVRHGKDDERYRGGWSRSDLTPEGIEQAKRLAIHLKDNNEDYRIRRIIASDLPRTVTTARFVSAELGVPILQDFRLREINNGDLAGMLNEEAFKRYPGLFYSSLKMDEAYPNGESPDNFFKRIKNWFDKFAENNKRSSDNVLTVTHGGVIRIIYHFVNGIEWDNQSRLYKADHCGIHILNMETMKFEVENKTDFLPPAAHC